MSLAKAHISGQVVSDVEKRFTPNNTAVASFTLLVQPASRGRNAEPFELRVTCWSRLADAVAEQLSQGIFVVVEGKLTAPSIQQPDGSNKKTFELEASSISILPAPPQEIDLSGDASGYTASSSSAQPTLSHEPQPVAAGSVPNQQPAFSEDDIPF